MSYECEDCGTSFDTLSRLRLHDCSTDQPVDEVVPPENDSSEKATFGDSGLDRQELERDYPAAVGDLPELYNDAREGDVPTLYRAMAEYERMLTKVARGDARDGEDLLMTCDLPTTNPSLMGLPPPQRLTAGTYSSSSPPPTTHANKTSSLRLAMSSPTRLAGR